MLNKIGLNINLEAQPKTQFFQKLDNGKSDFHLLSLGNGTLDSLEVLKLNFKTGQPWNTFGYSNPQVDQLIDQIEVETDQSLRNEKIAQVWTIIKDDAVVIPFASPSNFMGIKRKSRYTN